MANTEGSDRDDHAPEAGDPPVDVTGSTSVMWRLGAIPDRDDPRTGTITVHPSVCRHGRVHPAALMLLADVVVGMPIEASVPDWTFTTDFSFRTVHDRPAVDGDVITARSRPLRHGSRLLVEAVEFVDGPGVPLAQARITFMRSPQRPGDPPKPDIGSIRARMADAPREPLGETFPVAAGVESGDTPGTTSLLPGPRVRRPGGFVQGAIMTLLGEMAAVDLAERTLDRPCLVSSLDARYLIGGRSGPLVAAAEWVGEPERGVIAVDVVDRGHDDVITTTFLVGVTPV